jgi:hypothetical protein
MIYSIFSFDNTNVVPLVSQPFCSLSLSEGEAISFSNGVPHCPGGIGGSLLDLAADGSVNSNVSSMLGGLTCRDDGGQGFGAITVIFSAENACTDNASVQLKSSAPRPPECAERLAGAPIGPRSAPR